jgi:hypothetical protein
VVILAVVNAALLPRSLSVILEGGPAVDWEQFVEAGRRVFASDLYEVTDTYGYRWSPVAAYGFAAMAPMGALAWRLLHVIAALALPTWPMRLITLAAWPFWYDVEAGNVMVFVLLAGAWAIRGNAVGIAAFVTLSLLVPRPLMLPILGWILWQHPGVAHSGRRLGRRPPGRGPRQWMGHRLGRHAPHPRRRAGLAEQPRADAVVGCLVAAHRRAVGDRAHPEGSAGVGEPGRQLPVRAAVLPADARARGA